MRDNFWLVFLCVLPGTAVIVAIVFWLLGVPPFRVM